MITGKTTSGFSFEVEETAINDMRIVDAVAEIADGSNPLAISFVTEKILGKESKKALYKHVETEDGRVPIEKVSNEITEIFEAFGKRGKN